MLRRTGILFCCLLALLLAAGGVHAQSAWVDPAVLERLETALPGDTIPLIIRFASRVDTGSYGRRHDHRAAHAEMLQALRDRAFTSQRPLQSFLHGQGLKTTELWIVNGLSADVPAPLVEALLGWPGVEAIELNAAVPPPTPVPLVDASSPTTWNITSSGAPTLWGESITGLGITVAVLDTGVSYGQSVLPAESYGGFWYDPYNGTTTPSDYLIGGLNHGTAVTSVILGRTLNQIGTPPQTLGMAPDAQWIAARIFNPSGATDNAKIIAAMQWALDPDGNPLTSDDIPEIVNNSWGFESSPNVCLDISDSFRIATVALQDAGIHVLYAAGNTGPAPSTSVSPANYAAGFGVGSVGENLLVSRLSARGPSACGSSIFTLPGTAEVYPEMLAPGDGILVSTGTSAASVAGTSFSAPHVSGALALLRQATSPGAVQGMADYRLELEQALLATAADLGPLGPDNDHGYGLLDVDAAYLRLSGQPHLAMHTPGAPENDAIVDFGNIPPQTSADLDLTLRNSGGATLNLDNIATGAIATPFEVLANDCPSSLGVDERCTISLRFSPQLFGSFSDQLSILSNDARTPIIYVTLRGIGNSPPPVPVLLSPLNGSRASGTTVTLSWHQGADPDGDPVSQELIFADNPIFYPAHPPIVIAMQAPLSPVLLAGATLLFGGVLLRARHRILWPLLLTGSALIALSCGGGGGSDPLPEPTNIYTLSGLASGTTYYWKIHSDDSHGGVVESSVSSFTTP